MRTSDALTIGRALGRIERTIDAWEESKHPRADNGQFSSTNGGGGSSKHSESMQKPKMGMAALKEAQKGTRIVDKEGHVYVKGQHELPWKRDDGNRYSSAHLAQSVSVWPDDSNNASNGKLNNSEGQAAKIEKAKQAAAGASKNKSVPDEYKLYSDATKEEKEKRIVIAKRRIKELTEEIDRVENNMKFKSPFGYDGSKDRFNSEEKRILEETKSEEARMVELLEQDIKSASEEKSASKPPKSVTAKTRTDLHKQLSAAGFKMDSADKADLENGKINKHIILHKDGEEYMAELGKYRNGDYEITSIHK